MGMKRDTRKYQEKRRTLEKAIVALAACSALNAHADAGSSVIGNSFLPDSITIGHPGDGNAGFSYNWFTGDLIVQYNGDSRITSNTPLQAIYLSASNPLTFNASALTSSGFFTSYADTTTIRGFQPTAYIPDGYDLGPVLPPGLSFLYFTNSLSLQFQTKGNLYRQNAEMLQYAISTPLVEHWTNPNGGSWDDSSNWTWKIVPKLRAYVDFDLHSQSGYAVNILSPSDNGRVQVINDNVTWNLQAPVGFSPSSLNVVADAGQRSVLTLSGPNIYNAGNVSLGVTGTNAPGASILNIAGSGTNTLTVYNLDVTGNTNASSAINLISGGLSLKYFNGNAYVFHWTGGNFSFYYDGTIGSGSILGSNVILNNDKTLSTGVGFPLTINGRLTVYPTSASNAITIPLMSSNIIVSNGGMLSDNNAIISTSIINVQSGGMLSGRGTITGNVVNAGRVETELRGTNGRDVAAGAGPDHDDVE